ncbi:hypothetical protein HYS49_01830 [Candidatus Woesearchaeota archaeon]|nr:hypothetical protein [Candidatus Woesearchaeota archaeon]
MLSMAFPLYFFGKRLITKKISFSAPKSQLTKTTAVLFIVVIIALFSLYMYAQGAFAYPYLEDEDPWGHAVGAKYVALEKSAYDPLLKNVDGAIDPVLSYIDPYPPAYDVLMGVLHQTSPDLPWTMKFFNALIISLGFIFFYLFAKELMGDQTKAAIATFIFASIPSYLSHFIWAHALAVTLFFPTMYAFLAARKDRRWLLVAGILVSSLWVTQNIDQPLKLTTLLLIFLIAYSVATKKIWKQGFLAVGGGMILSLLWWGVMIKKYTLQGFVNYYGANVVSAAGEAAGSASSSPGWVGALVSGISIIVSGIKTLTNPGGSASRAYTFSDFFFARGENMINNPIGVGIVVSLLVLIGVVYLFWKYKKQLVAEENAWRCVALFWLIFTFWGVNGLTFPLSVAKGAFRVWLLLAIPAALIATEGFYTLKNIFSSKAVRVFMAIILVVGVLLTSTYQKYQVNTSIWPTSGSFSGGSSEPFAYGEWFKTLPPNTNVFLYAPRDKLAIGYGAFSCAWCQEVIDFRADPLSQNASGLHRFLRAQDYEYVVINARMDARFFNSQYGENRTNELLPRNYEEIINSGLFTPVYQVQNMFVVFKVG